MDCKLYKKKSLKFTYNEVSRNYRHDETLRARESSRFKRLSMLRQFDEEDESEDKDNSPKIEKKNEKKKPPSRFEMLFKWKQEKKIKAEIDKKNSKKPFYVGRQIKKDISNMAQKNVFEKKFQESFHSSKIAKSRLVTPPQPVKTVNISKQPTAGTSVQSLPIRIPNRFKMNEIKTANQAKMYVPSKNSKTTGNSVISSASEGPLPRIAKNSKESGPIARTGTKANVKSLNVKSQESNLHFAKLQSKSSVKESNLPNFTKLQSKSSVKTGIPTMSNLSKGNSAQKVKNQTGIPMFSSNLSKGISAQKNKNQVAPSLMKNVTNRRIIGGEKVTNSNSEKKMQEKHKSDTNTKSQESMSEQSFENHPALIFDCDISVIKRAPSFAPANFKFMPPAGLYDFPVEEEKFLSRTSTPSKQCQKSSSPVSEEACNESPLKDNLNSLPRILNLESSDVSDQTFPGKPICKETDGKNKIDNIEEDKLRKESGVNFSSDIADKVDLSNEKKCEFDLLAADLSLEIPLEIDINKIKAIVAKHKLMEQDEELNTGNDNLPTDVEKEEPAEDACIDSPIDIVDLNKIEDIHTKHVELMKPDDKELNIGNDYLPSNVEKEEPAKEDAGLEEDACIDSPFNIVDVNNTYIKELDDKELSNGNDNLPSDVDNKETSKASEDACINSPFDIVDVNKIEEIRTKHVELMKLDDKELNIAEDDLLTEVLDASIDSPLNILDLSKMEKASAKNMDFLELEEEELINYNQQDKYIKKPSCAPPKRASLLKNRPTLNSIAEISETDDSAAQTPAENSKNKRFQRLSKMAIVEENPVCSSAVTPRRSLRLQNIVSKTFQLEDSDICSPKPKSNPRRSLRLIDLNTPDKEKRDSFTSQTNLTADFQLLSLDDPENRNPLDCLIDLDCSPVKEPKARKVSLLYSPDKRKSIRKSIRGDLMSFSPNN